MITLGVRGGSSASCQWLLLNSGDGCPAGPPSDEEAVDQDAVMATVTVGRSIRKTHVTTPFLAWMACT
ncbi:MAG: hypothetical protein HXS50_01990 [Theionarchaea archaeon]|nr:hypothetical protein [Theionarchaea archaeon]